MVLEDDEKLNDMAFEDKKKLTKYGTGRQQKTEKCDPE